VQACLEDPQGARAIFSEQQSLGRITDGPAMYPMLLASLQDGHLEAAQLLLLAQLLHQDDTQLPQTTAPTAPQATAPTACADMPSPSSLTSGAAASVTVDAGANSTTFTVTTTSTHTSTSTGHSLSPVVWPPMVLKRLALLATAGSSSSSSSNDAGKRTAGGHVGGSPLYKGRVHVACYGLACLPAQTQA
jgi:hypothetical protein